MTFESKTQSRELSSGRTFIGYKVEGLRGESLGRIEDLLISDEEGQVAYAVVSVGGLLRFGNKRSAVPWSALRLDNPKKRFLMDLDRKTLASMPDFDKDHWPAVGGWGRDAATSMPPLPLVAAPSPPALVEPQSNSSDLPDVKEMDHWGKHWQSHGLERR